MVTFRATGIIEFIPYGKNSTVKLARNKDGRLHGKIEIASDHPNAMLCDLAHELGHLLAVAFKLPDAMADPRLGHLMGRRAKRGTRADRKKQILNAEIEAWELASKICPQIPIEVVTDALESYGMKWRN